MPLIGDSKVQPESTALNIDGLTALGGTGLHQTQDHFIFSDNGTEKKITFSNLEDAIYGGITGDATIAAGGALVFASSQGNIETIHNTSLKIGRDTENLVDFATTDNKIIFRVKNVNEVELSDSLFAPVTNNGVGLGNSSLQWSDLFLASGGVVSFGGGEVTITHSSSGPTLAMTASYGNIVNLTVSGDITAFASDKRLKTNIEIIESPIDKINKLSGFTYNWDKEKCEKAGFIPKDEEQIGVFAQDVQSVIPQAVKPAPFDTDGDGNSKSGDNYLTVQYEKIVPLLIECIKDQQKQIDELKKDIMSLK